jgi:cell division septum initiation protein DivIVA
MATTPTDQPLSGLPPDQVQAWLESVQDQVRRVQTRIEYLQAEQARLQEQESLLMELLASASAPVI